MVEGFILLQIKLEFILHDFNFKYCNAAVR